MRFIHIVILPLYGIYAYASPISIASKLPRSPSTTDGNEGLGPITVEVASNGVIIPTTESTSICPRNTLNIPRGRFGHGPIVQHSRSRRSHSNSATAPTEPTSASTTAGLILVPLRPGLFKSWFLKLKGQPTEDDSPSDTPATKNHEADAHTSSGSIRETFHDDSDCLSVLQPLRDLAERLVWVKEAPHHTIIAVCHFKSLNTSLYDGHKTEHMKEICWHLFETIRAEGRKRYERCISKTGHTSQYNANSVQEGETRVNLVTGLEKLNYHAYQVTPENVDEFIKEHPNLSPEDIEWLNHDFLANKISDAPASAASKKTLSPRLSKRSWFTDLWKSIFSAEFDTAIDEIGKGVEEEVENEVHAHEGKRIHATRNPQNRTLTTVSVRDKPSGGGYSHGIWYPIAPINEHEDQIKDPGETHITASDIHSYLGFVRDIRHLDDDEYVRLRDATERELNVTHGPLEAADIAHLAKRAGSPPSLSKKRYRHPYRWDYPPELSSDPAYINLVLAWNNTVPLSYKAWVNQQLRNVWQLRTGDLCNITLSWTKDLSEESQDIQLRFKGLTLELCWEIKSGIRENERVWSYWNQLEKGKKLRIKQASQGLKWEAEVASGAGPKGEPEEELVQGLEELPN